MKILILALCCMPLVSCQNSESDAPGLTAMAVEEKTIAWSLGDDLITIGVSKPKERLNLQVEYSGKDGCGAVDINLGPEHPTEDYYGEEVFVFARLPQKVPGRNCGHQVRNRELVDPNLVEQGLRMDRLRWAPVLRFIPIGAPRHHSLITLGSTHAIISQGFGEAGEIYLVFDVESQRPMGLAVRTDTFLDSVPVRHIRAQKFSTHASAHPIYITETDRKWRAKEKLAACLSNRIGDNRFFEATELRRDPHYREHVLDAVESQNFAAYPKTELEICLSAH